MTEDQINYMEFLTWVNRCLFIEDLKDDLIVLGCEKTLAVYMMVQMKHDDMKCEIMYLYQNYCLHKDLTDEDYGYWLQKYLDQQFIKWESYKK